MSLVKPKDKADPFFYTLKLNGPGLILQDDPDLIEKEKKRLSAIKEKKSQTELLSHVRLPDPIGESIQERKDYGSYLSVIKNKDKIDFAGQDREVYALNLKGKGISSKHLKITAQEMLETGDYNTAIAPKRDIQFQSPGPSQNNVVRRKISDRKKSA